jgi:hypothetical protein
MNLQSMLRVTRVALQSLTRGVHSSGPLTSDDRNAMARTFESLCSHGIPIDLASIDEELRRLGWNDEWMAGASEIASKAWSSNDAATTASNDLWQHWTRLLNESDVELARPVRQNLDRTNASVVSPTRVKRQGK